MAHALHRPRPEELARIAATDTKKLVSFAAEMIRQGLFVLPNNRRFISIRHTDQDFADTLEAADRACKAFRAH